MTSAFRRPLMTSVICLAAMTMAASAQASIVIFDTPGAIQPDENVLLHKGETGLTVTGETNNSHTSVTFQGLEDLTLPASGQARIEAVDGGMTWLSFYLTDPLLGFKSVEFNINSSADGFANLTFYDQFGAAFSGSSPYAIDGNGENFFSASALDSQWITRVLIETDVEFAVDMEDVRQVRLGGIGVIPEPETWLMMVVGFGLVGLQLRRRKALAAIIN